MGWGTFDGTTGTVGVGVGVSGVQAATAKSETPVTEPIKNVRRFMLIPLVTVASAGSRSQ